MSNTKDKEKEDNIKDKNKAPTYKFQSDIKLSIDIKNILEEKILDAKIEFTLKESLDIIKKDFYEFINDVIKKKKQMTTEMVIARTLDTFMTKKKKKKRLKKYLSWYVIIWIVMTKVKNMELFLVLIIKKKVKIIEEVLSDEMEDEVL